MGPPERTEVAWQLDRPTVERCRVPLHVLTEEAADVARFYRRYWPAQRDAHGTVVVLTPRPF